MTADHCFLIKKVHLSIHMHIHLFVSNRPSIHLSLQAGIYQIAEKQLRNIGELTAHGDPT